MGLTREALEELELAEKTIKTLEAKVHALEEAGEAIITLYSLDIPYDVEKFDEVKAWRSACSL